MKPLRHEEVRTFTHSRIRRLVGFQNKKERLQIYDRFDAIATEGHFGDHKSVTADNSVWELRWVNGRRVYYSYLPQTEIIILLGGNKNGQKKDIARAERILSKKS